jgi:hypothetical protein
MNLIHTIPDAIGCTAALLADGWVAAARVIDDLDRDYLRQLGRMDVELVAGRDAADWRRAMVTQQRRLTLATCRQGVVCQQDLTTASRVQPPAVADLENVPAAAWTERDDDDRWRVRLWTGGEHQTVHVDRVPLLCPALSGTPMQTLVAWESDGQVFVWTPARGQFLRLSGRRPQLACAASGRSLLVVERTIRDQIRLVAVQLDNGSPGPEIELPATGDFSLDAHLVYDQGAEAFLVAWLSCPSWGMDERLGLHREINLWRLPPGATAFQAAPGTRDGFLDIEPLAFVDGSTHNYVPVQPRVVVGAPHVAVAFRMFRFFGQKCYGWDTWVLRQTADDWSPAARISPNTGAADGDYALLDDPEGEVGFFPCCDQRPTRTLDELAAGQPGSGRTGPAWNHRLEILRMGARESLPDLHSPASSGVYVAPGPAPEACPPAPELEHGPEGLQLVWADLHAHSSFSKCMSANDGQPADVLRFQRDVLGCGILCLTEHVEYMTWPEYARLLDLLEAMSGSTHVPLYGVEYAKRPAHHTNLYALERPVFDALRGLMLECADLTQLYGRISSELPPGSVTAIRHMHGMVNGDFGCRSPRVAETHNAEIEWAMEAMQTRGNMMVRPLKNFPCFPTNFLNAGARVGLVGGSDHSRGQGLNRFCLTGFWVEEATPRGILTALRQRRTIATANGKLALHARCGRIGLGACGTTALPVQITADLSSARTVRRVCLVRDGEFLPWLEVGARRATVELVDEQAQPGSHWYAVTAEGDAAPGGPPLLAHASPLFLETV